jgi:hypothetical protein
LNIKIYSETLNEEKKEEFSSFRRKTGQSRPARLDVKHFWNAGFCAF